MIVKKRIFQINFIIISLILIFIMLSPGCSKSSDNKESPTEAGSVNIDKEESGIYKEIFE